MAPEDGTDRPASFAGVAINPIHGVTIMSISTILERVADATGGLFLLAIGLVTGGALALVGA
jgi:hypothetical protein